MTFRSTRDARALLCAAALALAGCATAAPVRSTSAEKSVPLGTPAASVHVDRPQIVGFFPNVTRAELASREELRSALEHLGIAMNATKTCGAASGIPVEEIFADAISFEGAGEQRSLDLQARDPASVGCAFVAPGRKPMIVRGSRSPSSLVVHCPAAAAAYFALPQCCPSGWRCCSDGNVVGAGHPCP